MHKFASSQVKDDGISLLVLQKIPLHNSGEAFIRRLLSEVLDMCLKYIVNLSKDVWAGLTQELSQKCRIPTLFSEVENNFPWSGAFYSALLYLQNRGQIVLLLTPQHQTDWQMYLRWGESNNHVKWDSFLRNKAAICASPESLTSKTRDANSPTGTDGGRRIFKWGIMTLNIQIMLSTASVLENGG